MSPPRPETALELGLRLATGELDPVKVCEAALERARSTRSVFTQLTGERARREAAASAERLRGGAPRGPLDGVPFAWKDLVDLAGTPTTGASAARRHLAPAGADAPIAARLAAAGMVCIGKTNLSELAYSGLGLNPHYGTPANPLWDGPARIPGGSSSGSAVAVAAGVVPCAIGTDTSGSIRVPAAFCGIAGFKPTSARVDRTGVLPLSPTLDSVGPLARSLADLVALDAALRGSADDGALLGGAADSRRRGAPDARAVRGAADDAALRGPAPTATALRLLAVADDDAEPAVAAPFAAAIAALERAGAEVERRPLPAIAATRRLFEQHGSLVAHEAWRVHRALLDSPDAERLDRRVLRRLREGRALPSEGLDALLRERPALQAAVAEQLGGALALSPTVPHLAPELAPLERDDELFARTNLRTLANTMPQSYLDMPGVALPLGGGASLLVSGPPGADERVLAAALTIASVVD